MDRLVAPTGQYRRQNLPGGGVVAAVEPQLPAGRQPGGQGSPGELLQAAGPVGLGQAALPRRVVEPEA